MALAIQVLISWTLLLLSRQSSGYSTGAPSGVCTSMMPNHGPQAQNTTSPYWLWLTVSNATYKQKVSVQIRSSEKYKGFLLKALDSANKTVGTWSSPPEGTKFLKCDDRDASAMTHSNGAEKSNETYYWVAPMSRSNQSIKFVATVVKTKPVFWMNVQSAPIILIESGSLQIKAEVSLVLALVTLLLIGH
ncbi:putative defense protein 3 [Latimeria chalumnae]|uniref:putative defense protein 3 n=1 Tax=Latimeria chalumnae TaxID=7897 RepID=UPI00313E4AEE